MKPDRSVEERLKNYGEFLDRAIAGDEVEPSRSRVPMAWVATGAALFAALVGLFGVLRQPSNAIETGADQPADSLGATTASSMSGSGLAERSAPFAGTQGCVDRLASFGADAGTGAFGFPFDPATSVREVVIIPDSGNSATVQVLLLGDGGYFRCEMLRTADTTVNDFSFGTIDLTTALNPNDIVIIDQRWTTGDQPVGPGTVQMVGRAGANVTSVEMELPDGSLISAALNENGWFAVDGRIPDGVAISKERINWTTQDGKTNSASADQLVPPPDENMVAEARPLGNDAIAAFETLQVDTLDGATLNLGGLGSSQQPYVLIFTASWLGHPGDQNPALEGARWIFENTDVGVYFVAITDPAPELLEELVRGVGIDTPIVLLDDERAVQQLGIYGLPTTFLVGTDGAVAKTWVGAMNQESAEDFVATKNTD